MVMNEESDIEAKIRRISNWPMEAPQLIRALHREISTLKDSLTECAQTWELNWTMERDLKLAAVAHAEALTEERDEAKRRFETTAEALGKRSVYSIALARLVEALCHGHDIHPDCEKGAPHHYGMAVDAKCSAAEMTAVAQDWERRALTAEARIEALTGELDKWDGLRRAIAEIDGFSESWPAHGNAPLAIAASYSLLKHEVEALTGERDKAVQERNIARNWGADNWRRLAPEVHRRTTAEARIEALKEELARMTTDRDETEDALIAAEIARDASGARIAALTAERDEAVQARGVHWENFKEYQKLLLAAEAQVRTLTAEVERKDKALEPFRVLHDYVVKWHPRWANDTYFWAVTGGPQLMFQDLRAAALAISPVAETRGDPIREAGCPDDVASTCGAPECEHGCRLSAPSSDGSVARRETPENKVCPVCRSFRTECYRFECPNEIGRPVPTPSGEVDPTNPFQRRSEVQDHLKPSGGTKEPQEDEG